MISRRTLFALSGPLVIGLAILVRSPWTIQGSARVLDGDTLEIGGQRVRLVGIDAPELGQTCGAWACGQAAADALTRLVAGRVVLCVVEGVDAYKRALAVCRAGNLDLNARMVNDGLALAFRRYSLRYVQEENEARQKRRGMWAGEFIPPWEWRDQRRIN